MNQDQIIEKVRKLLALADRNDNEHQAEAAANKARELLEAYNLDMAVIGKETNGHAPRDDKKERGGLYSWQRELWNDVAGLNFCRYWYIKGLQAGTQYEHRLVGSKVNVIAAKIMAQYLQATVERLARDWVNTNRPGKSIFIREAIAYREGIASRLAYRLWSKRQERIKEDEAKKKEEKEATGFGSSSNKNTTNALVLADVISNEDDLNNDYIFGYTPGTSAKNRVDRERRRKETEAAVAELLKKQEEEEAANPELAAKRKAREKAEWDRVKAKWNSEDKKSKERKPTDREMRRKLGSYSEGYVKGGDVSLDQQINNNPTLRIK